MNTQILKILPLLLLICFFGRSYAYGSGISTRDSGYLSLFKGKYKILDKTCDDLDSICKQAVTLELIKIAKDSFVVIERNVDIEIFRENLQALTEGPMRADFDGGAGSGHNVVYLLSSWWFEFKSETSELMHSKKLFFLTVQSGETKSISYSYTEKAMEPLTGKIRSYNRSYKIAPL